MFPPPLDRRQALQFALWLCIPSSAIIHLLIFLMARFSPMWVPSIRDLVGITAIGVVFGLVKALFISAVVYQFKPAWRRPMILGSVVVLTLLEGHLLYELWTSSFPFGVTENNFNKANLFTDPFTFS